MAAQSSSSSGGGSRTVSVGSLTVLLVLSNLLALQLGSAVRGGGPSSSSAHLAAVSTNDGALRSGLELPRGKAVALPSVRIEKTERAAEDEIYGGKGDKPHLGGFTEIDYHGISPAVWKDMTQYFGVKSVLDVGCGRGISTSWFVLHGVDALCVEGSHDAVERTIIPNAADVVTEHDFSRGPWWPPRTVDAIWSVEFLEHVGRNFHQNYIPAFRKAALVFVTSSRWGGWHHVEVHPDEWWQAKMESYGFVFSEHLTNRAKNKASQERNQRIPVPVSTQPNANETYNAQHIWISMKVFINPAVASLPQHQHLFAEHGCYQGRDEGGILTKPCGGEKETALPPEYLPLKLTDAMDKKWNNLLKRSVKTSLQSTGATRARTISPVGGRRKRHAAGVDTAQTHGRNAGVVTAQTHGRNG